MENTLALIPPSGISGTIVGSIWALYRSRYPRLLTTLYGLQSFAIGSTFWATRSTLLHIRPFSDNASMSEPPSPVDRLTASTISGGLAGGSILAIAGGRRAFVPGTLVYALMGFAGQSAFIWANERHARSAEIDGIQKDGEAVGREELKGGWIDRVAGMKWTGLTKLSNEEYAGMLAEKVLKIDAQIAIIDEQIEKLKVEEKDQQATGSQPKPTKGEERQSAS